MSKPEPVPRPAMIHNWSYLTFLHWSYDRQIVERIVPPELEVETVEGRAWVGLVAFQMNVRTAGGRAVPWLSTFPEMNVRTYVRGPDGHSGIWFASLEASRLGAVLAARARYHLPYMWARMRLTLQAAGVRYESSRLWPGPRGTKGLIEVVPGGLLRPDELGPLDHFLTARWRLYSGSGRSLVCANVEHEPWPLQRARLVSLRHDLVEATGLTAPQGDPLVHFSPGVEVRIGRPERLRPA